MSEAPTVTPSAVMTDTPAPPTDQLPVLRQQADARIAQFKSHPEVSQLLARGDVHAKHELARLEAVARIPASQVPGAQQTEAEVEQHIAGLNNYVGAGFAEVYGPELGPRIEAEVRANTPITPSEFRQAKAAIEEMKDSEFQAKLKANNLRAKARWTLAHNMIVRPIRMDEK
jgi:hypothetical protein